MLPRVFFVRQPVLTLLQSLRNLYHLLIHPGIVRGKSVRMRKTCRKYQQNKQRNGKHCHKEILCRRSHEQQKTEKRRIPTQLQRIVQYQDCQKNRSCANQTANLTADRAFFYCVIQAKYQYGRHKQQYPQKAVRSIHYILLCAAV